MRAGLYDFVVFLDVDWNATIQKNRQHFLIRELARQLERNSKILAVERPICPWTGLFRNREKFTQWLHGERGLRRAAPNLYVYTPFVLVHNLIAARISGLTAINRRILTRLLERLLKMLDFRDDLIAWIHHPYQLEDIGLVGEKYLIYDCYDEYLASERGLARREDLQKREHTILERASLVLFGSEELLRNKRWVANAHLLPNAVDFEHFVVAAHKNNQALVHVSPLLGFTGKLTSRLDYRLLSRLALNHPDWRFILIGPKEGEKELGRDPEYYKFVAAPNVHLLGPVAYRELPLYMRDFDVCLLPYIPENSFNANCSPLKLYEYLATGKPIVSADLPAVNAFEGLVRIGRDANDFERQLITALSESNEGLRQRRLYAARENSWKKRVEALIEIINASLK